MPRENSFSDEGRSLTPDLDEFRTEDDGVPPVYPTNLSPQVPVHVTEPNTKSSHSLNQLSLSKTIRSRATPSLMDQLSPVTYPSGNLTPKEKFRTAARKVIFLNRGTSLLTSDGGRIGAEPGINPRRASAEMLYGHIRQECAIEVVDYSAVRSKVTRMTNAEFVGFMHDSVANAREPWVKVRWINIGGMSWDVMKAISIKYDLHPLALEDVFHARSENRSKADYYPQHLFLRVLSHELVKEDEHHDLSHLAPILSGGYRTTSPEPLPMDSQKTDYEYDSEGMSSPFATLKKGRFLSLLSSRHRDDPEAMGIRSQSISIRENNRKAQRVALDVLKRGERVNVKVSPMFIFLLRSGVVISIHPAPVLDFTSPISMRLRQRQTNIRASADPSLVVHALLDLVVDKALEVIDEYHKTINKFERDVLSKPNIRTVRYLHILSGDLILHKRTLEPIKSLIYGLRRYDVDRCAALVDASDPANANIKIVGFMSHKAKIYLADVYDHIDYVLNSLDMFAGIAENLIGYIFNLTSYEMNEVMRRLTITTIICLPLTLLTGYFGMNFEFQWSVKSHSDLFFWEIAIPIMTVIILLFTLPDIKRTIRHVQRRYSAMEAVKALKSA